MKITIYTINDCKFSQAEKQYLTSKNMQFEEKNLETNREYLTEMLNISNNFAGTPVTKIEKDDGTSVVLKGFTQSEFDAALGLSTDASTTPPAMGVGTAAVGQAASAPTTDTSSTTPAPVSSMEPTAPASIDMSASTTEPSTMNTPSPSMPSSDGPVMPQADMSKPIDTASDPVAANPTPTIPAPMGNPLTDTTPTAPSMNDVMSAPQGEAIPSTPATDTPAPTMDMGVAAQTTDPMSMGQQPTMGTEEKKPEQTTPANDPLNSVLNDLQSKGSN